MLKFDSIPLSDNEDLNLQLKFDKTFEKEEDEYFFDNIELKMPQIKNSILKPNLPINRFRLNFNSTIDNKNNEKDLKTKFGKYTHIYFPKYNFLLMDDTNSLHLIRISIRNKKNPHKNSSNPFVKSPILDEFSYKQSFSSVVSLGGNNEQHGFHIPIENFKHFEGFEIDDVKTCWTIFAKFSNIIKNQNPNTNSQNPLI